MRIAYLLPINIDLYEGVLNKIRYQVESWLTMETDVIIFLITNSKSSLTGTPLENLYRKGRVELFYTKSIGVIPVDLMKDWLLLPSVYSKVIDSLNEYNPDIIYTRNSIYQPFYG